MEATVIRTWQAQYDPAMSGHCNGCGLPRNGRDTNRTHTVWVMRMGGKDYDICDRHRNLSPVLRKAHKRTYIAAL
jgi:hypothetical protein